MAEEDKRKDKQLFVVSYETPDDYVSLVGEYKKKFELRTEGESVLMETLPGDETCIQAAICIRVAASSNEKYRDSEFLPLMIKYFETVKNPLGQDFESRAAYFLLGIVAERESVWKTRYTDEELATKKRAELEDGVMIPQGEPGDSYDMGEVPGELIRYAKGVILDHLKTTESWQDIRDLNDLMSRVTEYLDLGSESESTYLKTGDCREFVGVIEGRRGELEKMGKEMTDQLESFDTLKEKLANQPRHVSDGAE